VVFAAVLALPSGCRGSSPITLETEHGHGLILVIFVSRIGGFIDGGDRRRRFRGSGGVGSL
jgi:hypothetical protein